MVRVSVIGGSGYTGEELLRILSSHPEAEIAHVTSRELRGLVSDRHPALKGIVTHKFEKLDIPKVCKDSDIVFLCTPHGASMEHVPSLLDQGVKVVDLSGDFRHKNKDTYEKAYGKKHSCPELLKKAVYGLPELYRKEIKKADLVANPGCYPTSAILGIYPVQDLAELAIVDAKSGVSGAGVKATDATKFTNVNENVIPYKITSHRHTPEMHDHLKVKPYFTPHLAPLTRGIESTIHIFLKKDIDVKKEFEKAYRNEFFVRLRDQVPLLTEVRGSNFCDLYLEQDGKRLVVVSVIDNLTKGASGQAVQNMNLMAGLEETTGLTLGGVSP
jgi:N-acetyl-gamma-glutamyl-phosphate reductase